VCVCVCVCGYRQECAAAGACAKKVAALRARFPGRELLIINFQMRDLIYIYVYI